MNKYDLVIIGGGLSGCFSAIEASKKGYSVVLVEKKTFLGSEITSGLFGYEWDNIVSENPDVNEIFNGKMNNAVLKNNLLEILQKYGVKVIFVSCVSAVLTDGDEAYGVLLSNRFGQQIIYASYILDTTDFASVIQMSDNENSWNYNGKCVYRICYNETEECPESEYTIDGYRVDVKKAQDKTVFATFTFDVNSTDNCYNDIQGWNEKATLLVNKIDNGLSEYDIFKNLKMIQTSYEVGLLDIENKITLSKKNKNIKSIIHKINQHNLDDSINLIKDEIDKISISKKDSVTGSLSIVNRNINIPLSDCELYEIDDHKMPVALTGVRFDYEKYLPVLCSTDVLVAGGGTAGTASAISASLQGASVAVADENPGFGGTQTYGSVCRYYAGYKNGYSVDIEKRITKSTPVYKRLMYEFDIKKQNVQKFHCVSICGAVSKYNTINGVVIASDMIFGILKAKVTIDATGNADVLAFAGAEVYCGSYRDGNQQNFSQSVIEKSGLDLDVINHCKYSEILRGIYLSHKQYELGDYSTMLTTRGAREFEGDYKITVEDVLNRKHYKDRIAMAVSDNDPHGALSSIYYYMGRLPFQNGLFELEVPYSACIPKGYDGVLVAGKSISAESDVISLFRMSPDVINRGYALGIAAALASKNNLKLREISYKDLKDKLIKAKILPDDIADLRTLLESEKYSVYDDSHPNKPGKNKGGIIGEEDVYWKINKLITRFAVDNDTSCRDEIIEAIYNAKNSRKYDRYVDEYIAGLIYVKRINNFDRIRSLCFYVEQNPDSCFVNPLTVLINSESIKGNITRENVYGENYQDAYIELTVARTLARCGGIEGVNRLIDFLDDIHYILSKNAYDELVEICGVDFGFDSARWRDWANKDYVPNIKPYIYENGCI